MDMAAAQQDMRRAYVSGATGILASSIAWFAATAAACRMSPEQSVWVLFVGGMLIYPASVLISKALGASGAFAKDNPLGGLSAATTFWLIFSLPLAYVASLRSMDLFFPAMLLIIGGRYLCFGALYGMRLYWVLGMALAGAGFALAATGVAPVLAALTGATLELCFAVAAFVLHGRWAKAG